MNIRLEVLNFLTTNGSQSIGVFACLPCRRTGWNFFYRAGFSEVNNIPAGEDWDDYRPVLTLGRLAVSQLAMVSVSFSTLIVMLYAAG